MTREVIFAPEALTDLFELYDYIADNSGAERARNYTDRIVATCRNLVTFPERAALGRSAAANPASLVTDITPSYNVHRDRISRLAA